MNGENAVVDRRFYAFRSWPSSLCPHCKRDVLVKLDQHYCAVGVQCRDGCGQLVSLRGDGAVLGWWSGMTHACPPKRVAAAFPKWTPPMGRQVPDDLLDAEEYAALTETRPELLDSLDLDAGA